VFGNLAAEYNPQNAAPWVTCYLSSDHLGSTRMVTDGSGTLQARHDYLPFGVEMPRTAGTADGLSPKFTGQDHDTETGLEFFQARYLASGLGRFMSVDPAGDFVADFTDPQSWNRYSYVRNNPLAYIDPSGMTTCDANGNNCYDSITVDGGSGGGLPINCFFYSFLCGGGGGGGQPGQGGNQPNPSLIFKVTVTSFISNFSIRQPGQTFKACMAANANTYRPGNFFWSVIFREMPESGPKTSRARRVHVFFLR